MTNSSEDAPKTTAAEEQEKADREQLQLGVPAWVRILQRLARDVQMQRMRNAPEPGVDGEEV